MYSDMEEADHIRKLDEQWPAAGPASDALLESCRDAIRACPRSAVLMRMYGDLLQLGVDDAPERLEEALVAYRRAVELDPGDVDAWCEIGCFLDVHQDDPAGAEAAFRRALALGGSLDTYAGLARLLAEQGRAPEALQLLSADACPWAENPRVLARRKEIERGDWSPIPGNLEEGRS